MSVDHLRSDATPSVEQICNEFGFVLEARGVEIRAFAELLALHDSLREEAYQFLCDGADWKSEDGQVLLEALDGFVDEAEAEDSGPTLEELEEAGVELEDLPRIGKLTAREMRADILNIAGTMGSLYR